MNIYAKQHTISDTVFLKGIGLHSGNLVNTSIYPAPANTGIIFVRKDLDSTPEIPLKANMVRPTPLCTTLYNDNGDSVATIEHLLAAFASLGINNALVHLDSPEVPILDGSSMPWLILLQEVGIKQLSSHRKFISIKKHVRVEDGDKWAEVYPSDIQEIDFTIDFDHPAIAGSSLFLSFVLTPENFREISTARTFGFMSDVEMLRENGLALGGGLHNAVVLDKHKVLNKDGLRHPDEFIRHKVLDAVGDFYANGDLFLGHFKAYKSGHALNNKLLQTVLADKSAYSIKVLEKK